MKLWRVALLFVVLLLAVSQVWADSRLGNAGLFRVGPVLSGSEGGSVSGWKADAQVGYFSTYRAVGVSLEARSEALATDLLSVEHKFPLDGVMLSASVCGPLTEAIRLYARAAWFVPFSQKSAETYLLTTTIPGVGTFPFFGFQGLERGSSLVRAGWRLYISTLRGDRSGRRISIRLF